MGPTTKPPNWVTVTGNVSRLVHSTSIPSVTVTTVGSIALSSMVIGTVAAAGVPTSVAEGDAAPVGDGVPPLGLVPTAEGLTGGAGVLVTTGVAVTVSVTIDVAVTVGVGGWVLSRTMIVPEPLLTLFMW